MVSQHFVLQFILQMPTIFRVGVRRTKGVQKMAIARSKAEDRYAQLRKRDLGLNQEIDAAARQRADKTARLRQLRLAKEAEDAAEKQAAKDIKAAGKSAFKKPRSSAT